VRHGYNSLKICDCTTNENVHFSGKYGAKISRNTHGYTIMGNSLTIFKQQNNICYNNVINYYLSRNTTEEKNTLQYKQMHKYEQTKYVQNW